MKPRIVSLLFLPALLLLAQAPQTQDVSDLLQKVAAAYMAISDYIITISQTTVQGSSSVPYMSLSAEDVPSSADQPYRSAPVADSRSLFFDFAFPGKTVIARAGSSFHFERPTSLNKGRIFWITNGQTVWHYRPGLHKYTEEPSPQWPEVAGPGPGLPGLEWNYFSKFRAIGGMLGRARLIRTGIRPDRACAGPSTELELQIGTADQPKTERLRILNQNNLVCQSVVRWQRVMSGQLEHFTVTTTWEYNKLSGPINPTLFVFTPPKGAKRVASFQ